MLYKANRAMVFGTVSVRSLLKHAYSTIPKADIHPERHLNCPNGTGAERFVRGRNPRCVAVQMEFPYRGWGVILDFPPVHVYFENLQRWRLPSVSTLRIIRLYIRLKLLTCKRFQLSKSRRCNMLAMYNEQVMLLLYAEDEVEKHIFPFFDLIINCRQAVYWENTHVTQAHGTRVRNKKERHRINCKLSSRVVRPRASRIPTQFLSLKPMTHSMRWYKILSGSMAYKRRPSEIVMFDQGLQETTRCVTFGCKTHWQRLAGQDIANQTAGRVRCEQCAFPSSRSEVKSVVSAELSSTLHYAQGHSEWACVYQSLLAHSTPLHRIPGEPQKETSCINCKSRKQAGNGTVNSQPAENKMPRLKRVMNIIHAGEKMQSRGIGEPDDHYPKAKGPCGTLPPQQESVLTAQQQCADTQHRVTSIMQSEQEWWRINGTCIERRPARAQLLHYTHEVRFASHPGTSQTTRNVQNHIHWPGITRDNRQYVRGCIMCNLQKSRRAVGVTQQQPRKPQEPFESTSLDLLGRYPHTSNCKRFILVVSDSFSRWMEEYEVSSAWACTITHVLETEFYLRWGYPRTLLKDNVQHHTMAVYHQQATPTERRNQDLKTQLHLQSIYPVAGAIRISASARARQYRAAGGCHSDQRCHGAEETVINGAEVITIISGEEFDPGVLPATLRLIESPSTPPSGMGRLQFVLLHGLANAAILMRSLHSKLGQMGWFRAGSSLNILCSSTGNAVVGVEESQKCVIMQKAEVALTLYGAGTSVLLQQHLARSYLSLQASYHWEMHPSWGQLCNKLTPSWKRFNWYARQQDKPALWWCGTQPFKNWRTQGVLGMTLICLIVVLGVCLIGFPEKQNFLPFSCPQRCEDDRKAPERQLQHQGAKREIARRRSDIQYFPQSTASRPLVHAVHQLGIGVSRPASLREGRGRSLFPNPMRPFWYNHISRTTMPQTSGLENIMRRGTAEFNSLQHPLGPITAKTMSKFQTSTMFAGTPTEDPAAFLEDCASLLTRYGVSRDEWANYVGAQLHRDAHFGGHLSTTMGSSGRSFGRVLVNVPPQNIFNYDETRFHDCPKKGKYLFWRQNRPPEIIWNSTKSCFTVMFCGNSSGELSPPYFVFKGKNKMSDWLMDEPKGSRLNVSKSGWVDMEIYKDWFCEHLLPRFIKYPGKKVINGDNLAAHMSLKALKLCAENDISFVSLIPNSTNFLQPSDVFFFLLLKHSGEHNGGKPHKTSRERVIAKLRAYANPAEAQQNMPDTIGAQFKAYVDSMRGKDLLPKQKVKRFHLPVIPGKSVSFEEVQNLAKAPSTSGGATAKKKKVTQQVQEAVSSENEFEYSSSESDASDECEDNPSSPDSTVLVTDESNIPVGNYVVVNDVLEPSIDTSSQDQNSGKKIVLGDYVVVQYKGSFYPGCVTNLTESSPSKVRVSAMPLNGRHWSWPQPKDDVYYNVTDVIKKINSSAVVPVNTRGDFKIDYSFLKLKWFI
ncbi:hypothetical protein PR048_029073 [Dryococelus australis]|uniref:Integrase catalytic domain-containing protein n=1 Tax=Dryococelus australis TaxID=614101 RepID=A0ABQ9GCX8_9NEOP|nr:hypothetical protein PR048_029073 [Dryococelus australis]